MADMLGTQRPKNVTTVKPSGTLSKIMDTTEGCHKPLGRYIFNNVNFGIHDPIVPSLKQAGYSVTPNPTDKQGLLVRFPVDNGDCGFYKDSLGREVCRESAIEQLERYRLLMREYVEHNCSITVSYKYNDIPQIVNWLMMNWDNYVGVAFMLRDDNTYAYLPQEVVTKEAYEEYVSKLSEVDFSIYSSKDLVLPSDKDLEDECLTGACPIK
jgi:ribonucleoside-triphosphate reductase (formate)